MPINLSQWFAQLLPGRCLLCAGHSEQLLCAACRRDLAANPEACYQCALPLPATGLCPGCQADPPAFYKSVAAFIYQQPLASLVNRWKHGGDSQLVSYLAPHLTAQLRQTYLHDNWPELLLPVPLHWRRRWQRGFNQAEQLAHCLGRQLQLPVCCRSLDRQWRHSQQGLDRKARLKNLTGHFSLRGPVQQDHVALVDDVMTTGATCATLAKLLQDHGVSRIDVWLIARTP